MNEDDLEKVTIRLPSRFVRQLDFLVKVDDFPSRSEAIRSAVRDLLYQRVEMVMDRIEEMERAETTLARMESFEERYARR